MKASVISTANAHIISRIYAGMFINFAYLMCCCWSFLGAPRPLVVGTILSSMMSAIETADQAEYLDLYQRKDLY